MGNLKDEWNLGVGTYVEITDDQLKVGEHYLNEYEEKNERYTEYKADGNFTKHGF